MNSRLPTFAHVKAAAKRIKRHVHLTPVLTSQTLNRMTEANLFFKCENFQKVGAFKFRGACNAVFSLSKDEAKHGVATHSSGNHGAAVAMAARLHGMDSYVVMPRTASELKKQAVSGYGAQITFCEPTLASREETCAGIVKKTGATEIHSYNDPRIIAGQGTAALELLEEVPDLDALLAPVGGGGLLSGTALAASGVNKQIEVVGVEPEGANDAYQSFRTGRIVPSVNPKTVADGLLTSLGDLTFAIIMKHVTDIVTVSESSIVNAMRTVWERMNIIIEPSSAVPVAALLDGTVDMVGKRVGVILSGGNVDLDRLPW
ncbi:MAG: pyridoxal-phosphate dependent enzyme [Candidatus Neomarinimicrobiota bacterium]